MGEYAIYQGARVKIGTCEDMYYLRADQRELVSGWEGDWSAVRFRFPWPDEDAIEPGGDFKDHKRSFGLAGLAAPVELAGEHHAVQFIASAGYNVCLPCPESGHGVCDGDGRSLRVHRNGARAGVRLAQQRLWHGALIAVVECGACGLAWRLETLADAAAALDVLTGEAKRRETEGSGAGAWYREVAERLRAGYEG